MFKLRLAFLFVVFLACNFYENPRAEDSEKQEDVISEKRAGLEKPWVKSNDDIVEEDGAGDGDDETPRDVSDEEGNDSQSRKRRYINRYKRRECVWPRRNYNHHRYICCGGRLRSRAYGYRCCGSTAYNPKYQFCCGRKVTWMSSGASKQCCGDRLRGQVYDTRSKICCGGTVHNNQKRCCRGRAFDPTECFCCSGAVGFKQSQICCRGTVKGKRRVSPECCGIGTFDSETHMCCGDKLRRIPAVYSECCGTYAYDYEKDMCRGGIIRSRPPGMEPDW